MPRDVVPEPVCDLAPAIDGRAVVALGVGPTGALGALVVDPADVEVVAAYDVRGGLRVPRPRTSRPYAAEALVHDGVPGAPVRRIPLAGLELAFPRLQPLADGGVLVAGSRARLGDDGAEPSAEVRDADGRPVRSLALGDGLADVQVAADGAIWCAYTAEGVEGGPVWDEDGFGDEPVGAPGLVRFAPDGGVAWRYEPPGELAGVVECRALNVGEDATWASYALDYPLVRVGRDDAVHVERNELHPVAAIAVHPERPQLALVLGHDPAERGLALCRLLEGWVEPVVELRPLGADGAALGLARLVGRGPVLHLVDGTTWYRLDVREARR